MPRPKKPTNLHVLTGTYRPDRHGPLATKPVGSGDIGRPPRGFDADQRRAWRDIVQGAPAGVLTGSDRVTVELAARTLALVRTGDPSTVKAAMVAQLVSLLGRLGMTPCDRARLNLPAPAQPKPATTDGEDWDEFFDG